MAKRLIEKLPSINAHKLDQEYQKHAQYKKRLLKLHVKTKESKELRSAKESAYDQAMNKSCMLSSKRKTVLSVKCEAYTKPLNSNITPPKSSNRFIKYLEKVTKEMQKNKYESPNITQSETQNILQRVNES